MIGREDANQGVLIDLRDTQNAVRDSSGRPPVQGSHDALFRPKFGFLQVPLRVLARDRNEQLLPRDRESGSPQSLGE
jgi:hypothetical protein